MTTGVRMKKRGDEHLEERHGNKRLVDAPAKVTGTWPLEVSMEVDQGCTWKVDQWGIEKVDVDVLAKWTLSHVNKVEK